mgnify:CR=1 FL=1
MTMLSLVIVSILPILLIKNGKCGFSFAAGMFTVSMSLIAGTLKNKIQKCTCNKKLIEEERIKNEEIEENQSKFGKNYSCCCGIANRDVNSFSGMCMVVSSATDTRTNEEKA